MKGFTFCSPSLIKANPIVGGRSARKLPTRKSTLTGTRDSERAGKPFLPRQPLQNKFRILGLGLNDLGIVQGSRAHRDGR